MAGGLLDHGGSFLRRDVTVSRGKKLLIADGLHGSAFFGNALGQKRLNFRKQALLQHNIHPTVNTVVKILPVFVL